MRSAFVSLMMTVFLISSLIVDSLQLIFLLSSIAVFFFNFIDKVTYCYLAGLILESKGICTIFQKKGKKKKKRQKMLKKAKKGKFGQKCIKFEIIVKKSRCGYCTQ